MNLKPIHIFYEEKEIPKVCSLTTKSLLRTTKSLLKSDKTEPKILLGSESIIMKRKEKGDHDEIVRCPGEHDARVAAYSRTANDAINAINNVHWLHNETDHQVRRCQTAQK